MPKRANSTTMQLKNGLCSLLVLLGLAAGCKSNPSQNDQVAAAVDALYVAMVDPNHKQLENLTAKDLTYGHSSGLLENKEQYIESVVNGPFDFIAIDPTNQTISISGDTAVVRHIFIAEAVNSGEPVAIRIGVLMIFQNQNSDWKLIARQAYKL